jgi:hypothetical protein
MQFGTKLLWPKWLLLFLALAIGGLAVAYTGVYDVSASSGHTTAGRWVLRTAMQNSVRSHAADVPEQERFTAAATHAIEALKRLNRSAAGTAADADVWTPATRRIAAELYACDFEALGYAA